MALENNFGKEKVLKASFLFWNNTLSVAKQKIAENIIINLKNYLREKIAIKFAV